MKRIVITGANEGIGFNMAKQLLEDYHKVAVLDINISNLEPLKELFGNNLLYYQCDITDEVLVKDCIAQITAAWDGIDYAIHNACKCLFTSLENTSDDNYQAVMDVNYFGSLHLTKAVLPIMKQQHNGRIFYTSSGVGVTGFKNISAYACSKGAIEALAKCMNIEYADAGISFHILHPPLTKTASAAPLPVPDEFMAKPEEVGAGFAKRLTNNSFIICHSFGQTLMTKLTYLFPVPLGKKMSKMVPQQ